MNNEMVYIVVWPHIIGDDCPLHHVQVFTTKNEAENAVKNTLESHVVMYQATMVREDAVE